MHPSALIALLDLYKHAEHLWVHLDCLTALYLASQCHGRLPQRLHQQGGTVLIRVDLLGRRCWRGGGAYRCVSRKLIYFFLTAGGVDGVLGSLAPWSVSLSFVTGWFCVEFGESTAVVFLLVPLLSKVLNFHAAMASTLVSAVIMALKSK